MSIKMIEEKFGWPYNKAENVASSLVDRGMIIEIAKSEYESLHPRFAITNRYRRKCAEEGIAFKKNLKVDNLGAFLERYYDHARTK